MHAVIKRDVRHLLETFDVLDNDSETVSLFAYLRLGLRRGAFTCVKWQVTLCDPIRQVTLRSSEMGFPLRAITFNLFKDSRIAE